MNRFGYSSLVLSLCLLAPSVASAQEKGKAGIFMGSSSLGLIWHASDKIAVRPEISFSSASVESGTNGSDNDSISVGASVMLYVAKYDSTSVYFAPRYAYSRGTVESHGQSLGIATTSTSTASTSLFSASIGAQHWLGSRFSVFGEMGVAYSSGSQKSTSSFQGTSATSDLTALSTRAAVAAVLYF